MKTDTIIHSLNKQLQNTGYYCIIILQYIQYAWKNAFKYMQTMIA